MRLESNVIDFQKHAEDIYLGYFVWTSPQVNTKRPHWWYGNTGLDDGSVQSGTMPLPPISDSHLCHHVASPGHNELISRANTRGTPFCRRHFKFMFMYYHFEVWFKFYWSLGPIWVHFSWGIDLVLKDGTPLFGVMCSVLIRKSREHVYGIW